MQSATAKLMLSALALATSSVFAAGQPVIGLITKTETNPFFVKMKEGAQAEATKLGAKLLTGAGKTDGDNAGQVTAIENMIAAGAKTILITPSDSKAIVPAIKKARDKGIMVIALEYGDMKGYNNSDETVSRAESERAVRVIEELNSRFNRA